MKTFWSASFGVYPYPDVCAQRKLGKVIVWLSLRFGASYEDIFIQITLLNIELQIKPQIRGYFVIGLYL